MTKVSIDEFAAQKLRSLERRSLDRELVASDRIAASVVEQNGHGFVSFSCNDYLGLAHDAQVIAADIEATRAFGSGAGASRLVTGSSSLYADLEHQLAALKATEDAVVFGSGYLTSIGIIPLFAGKPDLVLIDALAHSCLLTGANLSGATVVPFAHNDTGTLASTLALKRSQFRHCLIVTEGVFSMDGDLAPLPELARLAADHDAWLLVDDAHGLGVVGAGRGSAFAHATVPEVALQMGTLSKAVGAYGGYLCASQPICDLVRNRARSFVYSTGLPPGTLAAASEALKIIVSDPERVARPLQLAHRFTEAFGLRPAESAIVPMIFGRNEAALAASDTLRRSGYLVAAIRPPTVPTGTARLRFTFSAAHNDADLTGLIDAVSRLEREPLPHVK